MRKNRLVVVGWLAAAVLGIAGGWSCDDDDDSGGSSLSREGESCSRSPDCEDGLRCIAEVCVQEESGSHGDADSDADSDGDADGDPVVFAGLLNPSFEEAPVAGDFFANGWKIGSGAQYPCEIRRTDAISGPMPSSGVYYLEMHGAVGYADDCKELLVYQDDVDIQGAKRMLFDYRMDALVGASSGTLSIEMLFTSQGTEPIWSKRFANTEGAQIAPSEEALGESVDLSSIVAGRGRFSIRITLSEGLIDGGGLAFISPTAVTLRVDNFRFE